jgi:hypothetical protein
LPPNLRLTIRLYPANPFVGRHDASLNQSFDVSALLAQDSVYARDFASGNLIPFGTRCCLGDCVLQRAKHSDELVGSLRKRC